MKLVQITTSANWGAVGRIAEQIGKLVLEEGGESYIAYGRYHNESRSKLIKLGNKYSIGLNVVGARLFDSEGLLAEHTTKKLISKIKEINPDVIQLHTIHGYYLNYKLLFEFLNTTNIPVVWTFHDCWAFTGHCSHFVTAGCDKWKQECSKCPLICDYPKSIIDRSNRNYYLKKSLFSANKNLRIVTVSHWLASFVHDSFLASKDCLVINNGIDLNTFKPVDSRRTKFRILGVSNVWNKDKGLYDYYKLVESFPTEQYEIVLVGLTKKQIKELPLGIIGLQRTNSVDELVSLYSSADVFVNLTYADSFPTVNLEALACGTPVITYKTGGSPEAVDDSTGIVVEQGCIDKVVEAIKVIESCDRNKISLKCRQRAEQLFDKDKCYKEYIKLYKKITLNK